MFEPKIRAIKLQKGLKFALLDNCFSDPSIEVESGIKSILSLF